MGIKKNMCCCGSGLGSSLMVRINVEKVLKIWELQVLLLNTHPYQMFQKIQQTCLSLERI